MKNSISFRLWGRYALFTDPITKVGGEKCTYHIPTYEAIKGILKSIYWKPTLVWHVDRVRVIKPLRTQTKGTKPLNWGGGNELAYNTLLHDVEYQVEAHFEWNEHRPELAKDRVDGKHFAIAKRILEKGGRQDIFLGTRDCQGYVEPCVFGEGEGAYDDIDELGFGLMFHSFGYPDETGNGELISRFWHGVMKKGVIEYPRVDAKELKTKYVRAMVAKNFDLEINLLPVEKLEAEI
ncbi:type I-C CRISPR-associated protein Cas5c [Vibrio cholerae]|uniref:type I-C CRISPR-associated protein Cas5c n=1 Tax=Vibrio cholerae TaxID=666 RepID=UPI0015820B61|nr:type I-C CRISPR-associated protein Cas5c [Vibrio cholerae]EGR2040828.1 type I-C CRISPR-associated protein Cas5 [Vibrio cholerae]EGR2064672.1 type I-C CRISPR-associated protein Cas5 [Vibrio cholerae]EGR2115864.1 type I-C CRISPR-associated protein Cas5 [Vibrio cholerae]EGR2244770.1 type I-C CRISPR-associated protein Cas5 [Vibrio cholerae]QKV01897.1 type I-C CRISPR-associated protein Cas5 [Vibrio cholerae]